MRQLQAVLGSSYTLERELGGGGMSRRSPGFLAVIKASGLDPAPFIRPRRQ